MMFVILKWRLLINEKSGGMKRRMRRRILHQRFRRLMGRWGKCVRKGIGEEGKGIVSVDNRGKLRNGQEVMILTRILFAVTAGQFLLSGVYCNIVRTC